MSARPEGETYHTPTEIREGEWVPSAPRYTSSRWLSHLWPRVGKMRRAACGSKWLTDNELEMLAMDARMNPMTVRRCRLCERVLAKLAATP